MNKKIALIEIGGSHDECLYSQVLFLKSGGYQVHVVIRADMTRRVSRYEEADGWLELELERNISARVCGLASLKGYLKRHGIHKAVINTAHGSLARDFCLSAGRNLRIYGVMHNGNKLLRSTTQYLISLKIRNYFLLSDFIVEELRGKVGGINLEVFYPIYFPEVSDVNLESEGFTVIVPGSVERRRRDYDGLVEEMTANDLADGIHIVLLGRSDTADGADIVYKIKERGLEDKFVWFSEFVSQEVFYAWLRRAGLILPLITPSVPRYAHYRKYKITGAYNLAYGFHSPLLMHDSFKGVPEFNTSAFYYSTGDVTAQINRLSQSRERRAEKQREIENWKQIDFDTQAQRYLAFIEH